MALAQCDSPGSRAHVIGVSHLHLLECYGPVRGTNTGKRPKKALLGCLEVYAVLESARARMKKEKEQLLQLDRRAPA
jgi:hypothetical protein